MCPFCFSITLAVDRITFDLFSGPHSPYPCQQFGISSLYPIQIHPHFANTDPISDGSDPPIKSDSRSAEGRCVRSSPLKYPADDIKSRDAVLAVGVDTNRMLPARLVRAARTCMNIRRHNSGSACYSLRCRHIIYRSPVNVYHRSGASCFA